VTLNRAQAARPSPAPQQPRREDPERGAGDERGREVDGAEGAGGGRHQRERRDGRHEAGDQPAAGALAVGDRRRGDAGGAVVVLARQGERPEVRRRPDEDEHAQEQDAARPGFAGGGPADQRGEDAGERARDRAERRARLEQHRVDDHVVRGAEQRERGREAAGHGPEGQAAGGHQREPDGERAPRRDAPGGDRPAARALHARVDVALEVVVEHRRAADGERGRRRDAEDEREARRAGEQHRRDDRDQEEPDDARLCRRDVIHARYSAPKVPARAKMSAVGDRGERA